MPILTPEIAATPCCGCGEVCSDLELFGFGPPAKERWNILWWTCRHTKSVICPKCRAAGVLGECPQCGRSEEYC